jgi:hypothetical protein
MKAPALLISRSAHPFISRDQWFATMLDNVRGGLGRVHPADKKSVAEMLIENNHDGTGRTCKTLLFFAVRLIFSRGCQTHTHWYRRETIVSPRDSSAGSVTAARRFSQDIPHTGRQYFWLFPPALPHINPDHTAIEALGLKECKNSTSTCEMPLHAA